MNNPQAFGMERNVLAVDASAGTACRAELQTAFEWLFVVFVGLLPLMELGLPVGLGTLTIADAAFGAVIVVGLLGVATGAMKLITPPIARWIAIYLMVAILSAALGDSPQRSFPRVAIDIYMGLLAIVSVYAVRSLDMLKRVVMAWMMGTALTVIAGISGVLLFYSGARPWWYGVLIGGYGSLPPGNYPRVHGLFMNMNMCCEYLVVSFVLSLACGKFGWINRTLFATLLFGICMTAAFTVSPNIGGILLAAGIWFWQQQDRSRNFRLASLCAGILGASAFLFASAISPLPTFGAQSRTSGSQPYFAPSSRLLCWSQAYEMWKAHPLLGRGTGLEIACPQYVAASGNIQNLLDAHNMYLNTAATKGSLGLLALGCVVCAGLWPLGAGVKVASRDSVKWWRALRIAFISAFVYGGLTGSFEHTRHLWVLLGLLTAARALAEAEIEGRGCQISAVPLMSLSRLTL